MEFPGHDLDASTADIVELSRRVQVRLEAETAAEAARLAENAAAIERVMHDTTIEPAAPHFYPYADLLRADRRTSPPEFTSLVHLQATSPEELDDLTAEAQEAFSGMGIELCKPQATDLPTDRDTDERALAAIAWAREPISLPTRVAAEVPTTLAQTSDAPEVSQDESSAIIPLTQAVAVLEGVSSLPNLSMRNGAVVAVNSLQLAAKGVARVGKAVGRDIARSFRPY